MKYGARFPLLMCHLLWVISATCAQPPLACNVTDISSYGDFNHGGAENETGMLFYTVTQIADTTMTDYVRDSSGQWPLDLNSDSPSSIDVVLGAPSGPYRISVDVTVQALPFRTYQERGIAEAIEAASSDKVKKNNSAIIASDAPAESLAQSSDKNATTNEPSDRVDARSYQRSDVTQKLAGYLRSQTLSDSVVSTDDEELQWMVSQWLPGGRVLIASPKFGLQHKHSATLCQLIAGDDFVISETEMERAASAVRGADQDGNAIVTAAELSAATKSQRLSALWPTETLLRLADENSEADLSLSLTLSPDGGICKTGANEIDQGPTPGSDRIVRKTGFGELIIHPVMDRRTWGSNLEAGQVSIGAMLLPNPLFSIVDTRADGQLDTREVMQIPVRLRSLDRNSDQRITREEIPIQVILVISQGPWANRLLGELGRRTISTVPAPTAEVPAWFTGMDANGDGLLARFEFLGDDQQFGQRDKNGDGLITAEEATDKKRIETKP